MKKIQEIIRMTGKIHVLDGLTIQGAGTDLEIGGADNMVIKNPLTNDPYIPGSSLKGKLRSQLEKRDGTFQRGGGAETRGEPCGCGDINCMVCTIFGAHKNPKAESAPTRIIVRDSHMAKEYRELVRDLPVERNNIELKAENTINRNSGVALNPRLTERIAGGEGVLFDYEILLQVLEGDDGEKFEKYVEEGLNMVQKISALGGGGSRGSGRIAFIERCVEKYSIAEVSESADWKA